MKINSIQYLRAIAAILVVYCHAIDTQKLLGISEQQHFYYLQNFGAIGVDIFFIISGFIISYVSFNTKGKQDGLLFLKKRLFRINPSYYLVSVLVLSINYFSKPDYILPWKSVVKTVTILPVFDSGKTFIEPVIMVGWTLAFEWLFYLIFAILIFLKVKNTSLMLIIIMGALTLFSFLPEKNIQLTFISNPILWEFCFGVMTAILYRNCDISKGWSIFLLCCGLLSYILLIILGYSGASEATYLLAGQFTWLRVFIWGLPSAMLVTGLIYLERSAKISFNNRIMLFLGEASFAIYLVHPRSLQWFYDIFRKFPSTLKHFSMDMIVIFLVAGSIAIGAGWFFFVEKRLNSYFSKTFLRKTIPQK